MMNAIMWSVAAIWGLSGVIVIVLFAIDERAHRRTTAAEPAAPAVVVPDTAGARRAAPAAPSREPALV